MNDYKKLLDKYNITPINISYKKSAKIIDTINNKYILKVKTNSNKLIYEYLNSRNFNNYLEPKTDYNDKYEIYEYIEDNNNPSKKNDLMYIISILHNITTTYENIDLDNVKKEYEENINELNMLNIYYHDLQEYIENKVYMSPAEYLLIRNISKIYKSLDYSKRKLDDWYNEKIHKTKERKALIHNNLSLEHFLESDKGYIISWNKAKRDNAIYDFLNFYRNEYDNDIEIYSLYKIYQSKYKYNEDERNLFLALLSKPWKIEFKDNNYNNTLKVRKLINYIIKTNDFILQENQENQKAQQEEFK